MSKPVQAEIEKQLRLVRKKSEANNKRVGEISYGLFAAGMLRVGQARWQGCREYLCSTFRSRVNKNKRYCNSTLSVAISIIGSGRGPLLKRQLTDKQIARRIIKFSRALNGVETYYGTRHHKLRVSKIGKYCVEVIVNSDPAWKRSPPLLSYYALCMRRLARTPTKATAKYVKSFKFSHILKEKGGPKKLFPAPQKENWKDHYPGREAVWFANKYIKGPKGYQLVR